MVGFRVASSCQRAPVPRYLRASCQRVSPEEMRIEAARPAELGFGATGGCDVVGRAIGRGAMGTIGDGCGLLVRVGGGFIVAKGMAASVSGYLLLEAGEFETVDCVDGETGIAEIPGVRSAIAASSSLFLAR